MPDHAKLSPSAAERWINCPLSVALSEGFEDTKSKYAAEGTLAHEIAAKKLNNEPYGALKKDPLYTADMELFTDEYVDYIEKIIKECSSPPVKQVEIRLDLSFIAPKTFGTADCILIEGENLHVIDFKYGENVEVEATENPQMMIYALGALSLYDQLVFDIKDIYLHIVQPRMNNFSSFLIGKEALESWCQYIVRPAAREAMSGDGKAHSGKWCKFCKAKAICREYGKRFNIKMNPDDPATLSPFEIAERIKVLKGLDSYLKILQEYALDESLKGISFPGFKVVEGRSTRTWKNEKKALKLAEEEGYRVYETKPLTLAKIEKLMGKKAFRLLLGEEVIKTKGKPTLVPEDDKREPINSALEEFKDIKI